MVLSTWASCPPLALREVNRVLSHLNNAINAPGVVRPARHGGLPMSKTYEEWIDHYDTFYKQFNYDLGGVLTEINMVRGTPDSYYEGGRDMKDAALCVLDHMEDKLRDAEGEYGEPMRVAGPAALFR
tara:strand:+ start:59 stop:439 length:381 start_codon:yes stop_codon:yes gene_type:complete